MIEIFYSEHSIWYRGKNTIIGYHTNNQYPGNISLNINIHQPIRLGTRNIQEPHRVKTKL